MGAKEYSYDMARKLEVPFGPVGAASLCFRAKVARLILTFNLQNSSYYV
jgi:hypothetical protein